MKENLCFRHFAIELYKQTQTKSNKQITLVIISIVVAKANEEIYVLSVIKIYSFHLLSLLCLWKLGCWKYLKWCSYFENPYYHAKL